MGKRGQVAVEYLLIVGFILLITIPLIGLFTVESAGVQRDLDRHEAQAAVDQIAQTAQTMFALGPPSQTTLRIELPPRIENITIGPRTIVARMKLGEGYDEVLAITPMNITGVLSPKQGTKSVLIEAREGYVWIQG